MNSNQIKKLTVAGLLVALGVACSPLNIPIGVSRCFPIQHMINILSAVLLGPWYGVVMAFATSLLRNLMGTGSLLAFPGSMCGAIICGLIFDKTKKLLPTCFGELVGTSIVGGVAAFPIATIVIGKEAVFLAYVLPFFISSLGGTLFAVILILCLAKGGVMKTICEVIDR